MEKSTSKREFRFVIDATALVVTIVDKSDNELRRFDVSKLSQPIRDILIVHGLKQKLTDDTMVSKIGEDGDRLLALDGLWDQLRSGEWEKERQGVARPPEALILFIMEKKAVDRQTAEASLKQAGKEKWDAIKAAWLKDIEAIEKRIAEAKKKAVAVDLTTL